MGKKQRIINKVLRPQIWALITAPIIVFAALVYICVTGQNRGFISYIIYCASAYCLIVLSLTAFRLIRSAKAFVLQWIEGTAFGSRYMHDPALRVHISLYNGMTVNFLYVIFRIAVGIRYTSVWFVSMAVYYFALGALRLSLILGCRKNSNANEMLCYRRTAWLLFLLNIPMAGMILLMIFTDSGFTYPGYVIYLSAIYTFYIMIYSAASLINCRRMESPFLSAVKVLNFVSALMSVLGLQTAMIAQFSVNDENFRRMMNAITGGFIWSAVILIAVYMLVRSGNSGKEAKHVE